MKHPQNSARIQEIENSRIHLKLASHISSGFLAFVRNDSFYYFKETNSIASRKYLYIPHLGILHSRLQSAA